MLRMDVSVHQDKIDKIQLTNRGTDCFVNSVVQLIKNTQKSERAEPIPGKALA